MLPFLLQCPVLLKWITSDCWNLTHCNNANPFMTISLPFDHRNTLHLSCMDILRMDFLGTPNKLFNFHHTATCHSCPCGCTILLMLKSKFLAEISSSAALLVVRLLLYRVTCRVARLVILRVPCCLALAKTQTHTCMKPQCELMCARRI